MGMTENSKCDSGTLIVNELRIQSAEKGNPG